MNIQAGFYPKPPALQLFAGELNLVHSLILEMSRLAVFQLKQVMQALDDRDIDKARQVVNRDNELDQFKIQIDAEVLTQLARQSHVAELVSTSKIAVELEKIGNEIAEAAGLVTVLYDPNTSDPNPALLMDIVKIGNLVLITLNKMVVLFENKDLKLAHTLLQCDLDCENELQEGIKHQLSYVVSDVRLIGRALDIMKIMKSLERCGEFCRNIVEQVIFLIEGIDTRHCEQLDAVR